MSRTEPAAATRPLATWFCPACGHESSVWGDWVVETEDDRVRSTCPECGATVDDRPRTLEADGEAGSPAERLTRLLTTVPALVVALCSVQLHWLGHRV